MAEIDLETLDVMAALESLGDAAQMHVNAASLVTAQAVESEAVARLRRQLGPNATGETEAGIEVKEAYSGNGFVVVSANQRMPNLPLWIEDGTRKGKPRSHSEPARKYFYVSVELEQGAHLRRIGEAVADAIVEKGLGEVSG